MQRAKTTNDDRIPLTSEELRRAGPPPAGTHLFEIIEGKVTRSMRGDTDVVRIVFEVAHGQYAKRSVQQSYSIKPEYLGRLRELFDACGRLDGNGTEELRVSDLMGKRVQAELSFETNDFGTNWPRLDNLRSAPSLQAEEQPAA